MNGWIDLTYYESAIPSKLKPGDFIVSENCDHGIVIGVTDADYTKNVHIYSSRGIEKLNWFKNIELGFWKLIQI